MHPERKLVGAAVAHEFDNARERESHDPRPTPAAVSERTSASAKSLCDYTAARRAKRGAHADLARASGRSSVDQHRDVHRNHDQQQTQPQLKRPDRQRPRRTVNAGEGLRVRTDPRAQRLVRSRVLERQPPADRRQLRLRLRERDVIRRARTP